MRHEHKEYCRSISFRVSEKDIERLNRLSKYHETAKSEIIRKLVKEACDKMRVRPTR
jgi:predicted DNA-binding protein